MTRSKKLPKILTKEEQKKLLDIFNTRYPTQLRNKTMIKLMLDTGIRLSEIVNLKWKNINLINGKIEIIEGKGAKDRILWVNEKTLEELKKWKEVQTKETQKRNINKFPKYVFTTLKGKKIIGSNIRNMLYKYSQKAGIKRISPHTLRHTFATELYRNTKNIRLVQKALGHSELSTTMIYTHIVDDELENAMKKMR